MSINNNPATAMKRGAVVGNSLLMAAAGGLCLLGGVAQAEDLTVYGKAHVSADYIMYSEDSKTTDVAIASNSSRIGFKGDKTISDNLTVIWKFENEIDVTAESKPLSARNRYLGLASNMGKVVIGYHDTPFKTFGKKAGVFHDTIGERRGILGAGAEAGNKMNIRGRNSIMYISPKIAGLEIRAMGSTGDDTSSDFDAGSMTSLSAVFSNKTLYAGVSWEDQSNLAATEATGLRLGAGMSMGGVSVNGIYEMLSSDTKDEFSRNAYGGSIVYGMGALALKAQAFIADDYANQADSGGMLYAVGADYKLDKSFKLYALYAGASNSANSKFVLAGSGHGEKYKPALGENLAGVSAGMSYKF